MGTSHASNSESSVSGEYFCENGRATEEATRADHGNKRNTDSSLRCCPQCTFLNKQHMQLCEMCGNNMRTGTASSGNDITVPKQNVENVDSSKMTIEERLNNLFGERNFIKHGHMLQPYQNHGGWINVSRVASMVESDSNTIIPCLLTTFKENVEIDKTKSLVRRRTIESRIEIYIHFLFSNLNWDKDLFLQHVQKDHGMVPIAALLTFKKLKSLFDQSVEHRQSSDVDKEEVICRAIGESRLVEVVGTRGRRGIRAKDLEMRVREQIEFYFSDGNYLRDKFLQELASQDDESFVDISSILTWTKMREMVHSQPQAVARALQGSTIVEVSLDGKRIRKHGVACDDADDSMDISDVKVKITNPPQGRASERDWTELRSRLWTVMKVDDPNQFALCLEDFCRRHSLDIKGVVAALRTRLWRQPCSRPSGLLAALAGNQHGIPDNGAIRCMEALLQTKACGEEEVMEALVRARVAKAESALPRDAAIQMLLAACPSADTAARRSMAKWEQTRRPQPSPRGLSATAAGDQKSLTTMRSDLSANEFKVVQFNVLADCICNVTSYSYADPAILLWPYRMQLLLDMIERWDADIIALQEVQGTANFQHRDNHAARITEAVQIIGYKSVYYRKTSLDGSQKPGKDLGNLLLVRESSFRIEEKKKLCFSQLLDRKCLPQHHQLASAQRRHYLSGRHGAAVARLRHKASGKSLIVASTHITCNYTNPDTQVAQASVLLEELQAIRCDENEPVLIMGDFNSTPTSGVYDLFSRGVLNASHADLTPSNAPGVQPLFVSRGVSHSLRLASAYVAVGGSEPELTNLKGPPQHFHGCLDYIWFSSHLLRAGSLLSLPSLSEAAAEGGGLPNSRNPSDHIPIGATLSFGDGGERGRDEKGHGLIAQKGKRIGSGTSSVSASGAPKEEMEWRGRSADRTFGGGAGTGAGGGRVQGQGDYAFFEDGPASSSTVKRKSVQYENPYPNERRPSKRKE